MVDRRLPIGFLAGVLAACLAGAAVGGHLTLPVVTGAVVATVAAVLVAVQLVRHRRLTRAAAARSRPAVLAGVPVRVGDLGVPAFVAGPWRPTIYCDRTLAGRLTGEQLRAVLLHERAHQRAGDVWRSLLLAALAPVAHRVRPAGSWLERAVARREIAADRYARSQGVSASALAGALLRATPSAAAGTDPAVRTAPGFTTSTQLRIAVLLGDVPATAVASRPSPVRWWLAGAALGAGACAWALHPLLGPLGLLLPCC